MFMNTLHFQKSKSNNFENYKKSLFQEYNSKNVGYYHLPTQGLKLLSELEIFKKNFKYNKVVVLGVGGSSLGAKAVASMLISQKKKDSAKLVFLENLDPVTIVHELEKIDYKNTFFLIVSKSGLTIETISITKIILAFFKIELNSSNFYKHFGVITDKNSPLENFAHEYKLPIFFIYPNVGGRFSVLSATALVPLFLCGYDIKTLLDGALSCEENIFTKGDDDIFIKAEALILNEEISTNILFSYSDSFREINAWYVQLWAESLGKKNAFGKRVGKTPVGLIGSVDQHSFLQLIMEGPKNKSVTFLRIKEFDEDIKIPNISLKFLENCDISHDINSGEFLNYQAKATMQSIADEGILVDEIVIDRLDAWHAGYLLYYYEVLTSICGAMLNINVYNQPGVEVGKKILKEILAKED